MQPLRGTAPARLSQHLTCVAAPAPLPRSDILTPLPAFGIPFEIDDDKGPLLDAPIRSTDGLKALHPIDLQQLSFVGESLGLLKQASWVRLVVVVCVCVVWWGWGRVGWGP